MTYQDIIKDKTINDLYLRIKNYNLGYKDHSIKHRNNVINYCKKLIDIFEIEENIANNILIAASLHDIGRAFPNETIKHAELSSIFTRTYLKDKIPIKDIDFICNLIEKHGGIKERTFYEEILNFADKMDFTKDRLEDNYQEKYGITSVLEHIKEITCEIINDIFILYIKTDEIITFDDLVNEKKKYNKLEYNISSISSMKNLKYRVYWDNKIIFEGNKKIKLTKNVERSDNYKNIY